jgi:hypothetical protein
MVCVTDYTNRPFSNLKRSQKARIRKELEKKEKEKYKQVKQLK